MTDNIVVSDLEETGQGWRAQVVVGEEDDATAHSVTVDRDFAKRLMGDNPDPRTLLVKTFDFLLKREPKESILKEFNLSIVSRYFPDYEEKITSK